MVEMKKEKEEKKAREAREAKHAKNTKNAPTSTSRPSEINANLQFGEGGQMQPTPGLHSAGLSTSSTPVTAAASTVSTRWARFWLTACCIPAQNANDHH
jgi:hypothetical protein